MKKIFTIIALVLSSFIVNAQWINLGAGLNGRVKALAVFSGSIYAGGTFSNPNHVAIWDAGSNAWLTAGNGLNDSVHALAVHNGQLYAAGNFTASGNGTPINRIAVLNTGTNTWQQVGNGLNNFVNALYSDGTLLYVGGAFNNSGSPSVSRIASWNGSAFSQVGDNPANVVNAITKHNSSIYIGGNFTGYVKRLAGSNWQTIGSGSLNNNVYALSSFGGYLFMGGSFTAPTSRIAKFDGSNITAAVNTLNNTVHAMYSTPSKLFSAGAFTSSPSSGASLPHFASYNGNSPFFAEGSNFNGDILSITNFGGKIVVGGSFSSTGAGSANNVAISSQTINVEELSASVHSAVFFPNPVTEKAVLRIESASELNNPVLKIMNSNGMTVKEIFGSRISANLTEFQFERGNLSSGNYFYMLIGKDSGTILSDMFIIE